MSDLSIDDIYIIFTSDKISISNNINIINDNYLIIHVIPTTDKLNIKLIKIRYYNRQHNPSRIEEEISDKNIFDSLSFSLKNTDNNLLPKILSYIRSLPKEEISIIMKEYHKYIENGIISDGFIAGIASYISFIFLIENGIFNQQISFQITIPNTINFINRNMFQYLSLYLLALSKISNGILNQLITFIHTFINIWEPCFIEGPIIPLEIQTKSYIEIISGVSSNILNNNNPQIYIDKINRDIKNLIIDTKNTINNLISNVVPDIIIKEKINNTIDDELSIKMQQLNKDYVKLSNEISKLRSEINDHKMVVSQQYETFIKSSLDERDNHILNSLEEKNNHILLKMKESLDNDILSKMQSSSYGSPKYLYVDDPSKIPDSPKYFYLDKSEIPSNDSRKYFYPHNSNEISSPKNVNLQNTNCTKCDTPPSVGLKALVEGDVTVVLHNKNRTANKFKIEC